jgi:hypothetical protein
MMGSSPGGSMWDWFSACLMILGFTMLLGLSVYLTSCLLHIATPEPPDEFADHRPASLCSDERIAS